jgi:lipopolysaccharide assembly outer membrane protein LptD (OstA)
LYRTLYIYIVFFLLAGFAYGQEFPDSLRRAAYQLDDTTGFHLLVGDTTFTGEIQNGDSVPAAPAEVVIEAPIDYEANDSIIFSLDGQRVYMYGDAKVKYQQIELSADHIILDLETKEVYAEGVPDSTGTLIGKPIFQDGSEKFESKTLRYNFQTQKGIITDVVTEQGEGFVHSGRAKKISKDAFILQQGKYTPAMPIIPIFISICRGQK